MPTKKYMIPARDENGDVVKDAKGNVVKVDTGRTYDIDGKRFTWHPLDEDNEVGNLPDVTLPMRIKLGVLRTMSGGDANDPAVMFAMIEAIAPGQGDTLDEMDVNDFTAMFGTWNEEYTALTGATPGE